MFGKSKREIELEKALDDLKGRVKQLEIDCKPFRVGELSTWDRPRFGVDWTDPRPRLSMHQVAEKLMNHCKLEFHHVPATPGQIEVRERVLGGYGFIQSGVGVTADVQSALAKAPKKRKKRST